MRRLAASSLITATAAGAYQRKPPPFWRWVFFLLIQNGLLLRADPDVLRQGDLPVPRRNRSGPGRGARPGHRQQNRSTRRG